MASLMRKALHSASSVSVHYRKFSVTSTSNAVYSCKLLVVGGGSGGCTIASKFSRRLGKDNVVILEPNEYHYYQPLWTLVGAGVKKVADTRRLAQDVLPSNAIWVKDRATCIDPDQMFVNTERGDTIHYEYIVIAVGLQNDYDQIPGLSEALEDEDSCVSTIYSPQYCEKTFRDLQRFRDGNAIFTYPDSIIKCPGAPQKIAYLADSYMRKRQIRLHSTIYYNTCQPVIFGIPKYAAELVKVAESKNICINYNTVLKSINVPCREAVFYTKGCEQNEFTMCYNLLHVAPPMSPPDVLRCNEHLATGAGYLDVDKYTLQHNRFTNVFGIGDCTSTPNSKTAAAIAKQCYVLEHNLLRTMANQDLSFKYDGYGACPLVTSYSTCILAEFLYDGVVHETFPFDQVNSKESKLAYYMKKDLFPFIYWNGLLKGRYHGPEFVRKLMLPISKLLGKA